MSLFSTVVRIFSVVNELTKPPPSLSSSAFNGDDIYDPWDEGPDDLWPIEEAVIEPQLIVSRQYGLRFPSGDIAWNQWEGIDFTEPMDRIRMVATIQKTGSRMGFDVEEFTSHYGWVTRNQLASVVYEDTGEYDLTSAEVCSTGEPDTNGDHPAGDQNETQ